ncbi:GNAT family N-acetyltransferase [Pseudoalteromonas obscura]|uniref:GNAT family N-acetyltransferase n=1 Tax=Pseudoalteromonas obscura TaxID=3048491 RepID=A0ABT7EGZ6_9GAMM|nr:GNAT family N-acetyltransferase [Pseudoalteromonas sp. P94(2023)]MDK2594302.1 GNAT family N-acetyltransferase [Pseudoalteromonas sp. P94(2023)]
MTPLFQTSRLDFYTCSALLENPKRAIPTVQILTPSVVSFLPQDWQSPPQDCRAHHWLNDKLKEAEIYIAVPKQSSLNSTYIPLGMAIVHSEQYNAHLGYLIAEQAWGKGYGTELLSGVMDYLKHNTAIQTVHAGVDPSNLGSIRALEKCRFELAQASVAGKNSFYIYHF